MAATIQDVPIATPGGKDTSPNGLAQDISNVYQSLVQTQQIVRQHRGALIAFGTVENPVPVSGLGLTAGVGYSQAQMQAALDKIDQLAATVNQLILVLQFMASSVNEVVVEP